MGKRIAIAGLSVLLLGGVVSAADAQAHSIVVPQAEPKLPEGPGRKEFVAQCRTCHSSRYVTSQPAFTRKAWEAEVTKMMKTYGAPVPAAQVSSIVDYLVTLNGTGK
ncbi:MAG TPA: cytochrome c [Bryobacteraceae bacterium]|jgi:cytochrome c5